MPAPDKIASYWFGRIAEYATLLFLTLKGYRVLAHRHRTPYGELDIVCVTRQSLVVVEVKARRSLDKAAESLSPQQRERLRRAALSLLARYPRYSDRAIRFDCCFVTWYMRIRHIKQAFSA